ncbi:SiaB family protein kinase [Sediminitomix flava]|uniref:Uncharacterized protein n=1 Tax=Sediminitomix flava TaxID=379075 RepID=A0A315Z9N5_SEDFL|nr:SiaB family protein kinase [Sediminitomix flava]PWJ41992.1 hypothetical protein BC781_103242 [Sediminitomix flava]
MKKIALKESLDIKEYYEELQQLEGVIFSYRGVINADTLDHILSVAEDEISLNESIPKFKRRVHLIIVEALQNIFHHFEYRSKNSDPFFNKIIFFLSKDQEKYSITSGNFVTEEHMYELSERIDTVNSLSVEELKNVYRGILSNGEFSEYGGAGLGIIDLARKSGQKLEYEFLDMGYSEKFFCLTVNVPL